MGSMIMLLNEIKITNVVNDNFLIIRVYANHCLYGFSTDDKFLNRSNGYCMLGLASKQNYVYVTNKKLFYKLRNAVNEMSEKYGTLLVDGKPFQLSYVGKIVAYGV